MTARAIGSGTVSFGLVSIPVKVYSSSESSSQISFSMLHRDCGTKLKQQYICPRDSEVVSRSDAARGYEFARGQYVLLTDEEYKALQEVASNAIELTEFVPAERVDPIYFDRTYYLGPDKGGERAYRLLAASMNETGLVGLAKYAARGKQYLVLVRPGDHDRLIMHQLHYADEIKPFSEVPIPNTAEPAQAELDLAVQIIQQIATREFHPQQYRDEVKERVQDLIERKVAGEEITAAPEAPVQGQIIDLMEALKASLADTAKAGGPAPERASTKGKAKTKASGARKPAKQAPAARNSDGAGKPARKRSAGSEGERSSQPKTAAKRARKG